MRKRFSVIIATYNREDFLGRAIDSVLAQTWSDYELIVVDDGSTDRTPELLRSYGSRITVVRQENQGSDRAYKTGVSRAGGEYLAFLDSDDFFLPHALATYDSIISTLEAPPLVIGAMIRFEHEGDIPANRKPGDVEVMRYRDYLSKNMTIGLALSRIVMRRSVFEEVCAGTEKSIAGILNDYLLLLLAGTHEPCVIALRPATVAYRQHTAQCSKNIRRMSMGALEIVRIARSGRCYSRRPAVLDRYAYVGGIVNEWSRKAFRSGLYGVGLRVLLAGSPMLAAVLIRKIAVFFRPGAHRIIIRQGPPAAGVSGAGQPVEMRN